MGSLSLSLSLSLRLIEGRGAWGVGLGMSNSSNCKAKKGVVMAVPKFKGTQMREKQLTEMIEKKVKEAEKVCEGDAVSDECKVAWDEVEEISQAKADFRLKLHNQHDPLEFFCRDNPHTDECRIYDH